MRLLSLIVAASLTLFGTEAKAAEYLKILNSYVSVKLHLDHSNGQMVGAAWIRVRNNTAGPLSQVPFVLNPGLVVSGVTGSGRVRLRETSTKTAIEGYEYLELTAGVITLASPVAAGGETEVIIQYGGSIDDLSWTALSHAAETLNPDFTMLRADSFAYPVLAAPTKSAITAAQTQPAYYQTATIVVDAAYSVAGNLYTDEIKPAGDKQSWDLKNDDPTAPMTLPIAPYITVTTGPVSIHSFSGESAAADAMLSAVAPKVTRLQKLLGAPNGTHLNISMVPDGYGSKGTTGLIMLEQNTFTPTAFQKLGGKALPALWGVKTGYAPGSWKNSFGSFLTVATNNSDLAAFNNAQFTAVQAALASNPTAGKKALKDFNKNGWHTEAEALATFVLAGMRTLMGEDAFFAFARTMRTELRGGIADNAAFADFLAKKTPHKKARKFAKNWLKGKKAAKDMKKATNFSGVMARYQ